jgi:hypothetical protein
LVFSAYFNDAYGSLSQELAKLLTARLRLRFETPRFYTSATGITKEIYDKKHQEYQDKIQMLEIEMSEHQRADYDYQTTITTVISVARRAKTIFENSSDIAGKRAFLNFILQNPIVTDKPYPFSLVIELANAQIKIGAISDNCPSWLRWRDDVRTYFMNKA